MSLYITLLQGHIYLLSTVMVIANLVHGGGGGGGGGECLQLQPCTREVAILYIIAAYIIDVEAM